MIAIKGISIGKGRTIAFVAVALSLLLSCGNKKENFAAAVSYRDTCSVMTTTGISSIVSEQGMIKYRMQAEEWKIFDKMKPPYWSFERGVYLEVLDSVMNVTSHIKADTAYYYSDDKKWELRGNVHAENTEGEDFDTQVLFWDQTREKVYSDSHITIRQDRQVIQGRGFESNQNFTRYTIRKTEGVFPVDENDTADD